MYCQNCGNEVKNGEKFCGHCGAAVDPQNAALNHQPGNQSPYSQMQTQVQQQKTYLAADKQKNLNMAQLIVAIIALLNVMFVPIFDVWGGLFPGHVDDNFWDVIFGHCDSDQWVVVFTVAIFVPTFFMVLFSIIRTQKLAKISGAVGLAWMVIDLIRFVNQYEFDYLFDFDDGNLCIGLWIGFVLFIIMVCIPTKKPNKNQ